jgi:hypothetical protein
MMWLHQNQEGLNPLVYPPQQEEVVVEIAKAMEDGRLTPLEAQSIIDAGLAFGMSLIFGTALGVLMMSIVTEALEPKQEEVVQPVIDLILPAMEVDILDRMIREKKNDPNWGKWPEGSASDARKAVYKEILEGFRTLAEAKEYIEGLPEDNVIYTARGDEIPFSLIKTIISDIEKNPWLSPFKAKRLERNWQPPLLPQTHHSIPHDDLKRIAEKYGWWAARQAEALCPHNDVACVDREAKRLYEVVRRRMAA